MIITLEELVDDVSSGIVISRIEAKEKNRGIGEVSVLTLKSINCGVIEEKEINRISIIKTVENTKFCHSGDIILKMNRPYDSVYITNQFEDYVIPSFCCKLRNIKMDLVDPYYLVGYLNSDFAKEYLRIANGSSPSSLLKIKDIKKLPIALPEMTEQHAIGEVFKNCCERQLILREMMQHEMEMAENIIFDAAKEVLENEGD